MTDPDPDPAAAKGATSPAARAPSTRPSRPPRPPGGAAEPRVLLRHCPFREVAEHHREVVCALHLGLMQGVLAELRAPLDAERLDPFVEPGVCIARLHAPARPRSRDQACMR